MKYLHLTFALNEEHPARYQDESHCLCIPRDRDLHPFHSGTTSTLRVFIHPLVHPTELQSVSPQTALLSLFIPET